MPALDNRNTRVGAVPGQVRDWAHARAGDVCIQLLQVACKFGCSPGSLKFSVQAPHLWVAGGVVLRGVQHVADLYILPHQSVLDKFRAAALMLRVLSNAHQHVESLSSPVYAQAPYEGCPLPRIKLVYAPC